MEGDVNPKLMLSLASLSGTTPTALTAAEHIPYDLQKAFAPSTALFAVSVSVVFPADHVGDATVRVYGYDNMLKAWDTEYYHEFKLTSVVGGGTGVKTAAINISGLEKVGVSIANGDAVHALGAITVVGKLRK